ncbi:hypothetical protein Tco_1466096 [Tanacetum coccineum]
MPLGAGVTLTFFLGLQVQQKMDGIFISQDKYVVEILKKFRFTKVKTASTPKETQKPLLKDEDGEEVDVHMYRSMIGSLMYLTFSRPNIMFAVCAYARYQVNPKVSHLHAVKRIFRYLKGQPKLGLWYPKDSPFDLVAYTDSDYAKSTTGGCQFHRCRLISWQCKKHTVVANSTTEAEYVAASSCCGQVLWIQNQLLDVQLHALVDGKRIDITKTSVKRTLRLAVAEVSKELTRIDTEIPQSSGPTEHVADKAVHKERGDNLVWASTTASSLEAEQDSGNITKTQFKATLNELSSPGTSSGSGPKVLDLEKTKTTQQNEIDSLKSRVKKLDQKKRSRTHKLKRLRKIGATAKVESSGDEESLVSIVGAAKTVSVATTTTATTGKSQSQDKGKGIMIEEPVKKLLKKDQLKLDEEIALKLQAEIDKEERITSAEEEKIDEANIAWDDIQAKVDADYQLAKRLQDEEQE